MLPLAVTARRAATRHTLLRMRGMNLPSYALTFLETQVATCGSEALLETRTEPESLHGAPKDIGASLSKTSKKHKDV
jgi:hypothetical protein